MEFAPSLNMVRRSPFRALPLTGLALDKNRRPPSSAGEALTV